MKFLACHLFLFLIAGLSEVVAAPKKSLDQFFSEVVKEGIPSIPLEVYDQWEPEHQIPTKFGDVNYIVFVYWASEYSKVDSGMIPVIRKYIKNKRADVRYLAGMIGLNVCGIVSNISIADGYSLSDIASPLDSKNHQIAAAIIDSHLLVKSRKEKGKGKKIEENPDR